MSNISKAVNKEDGQKGRWSKILSRENVKIYLIVLVAIISFYLIRIAIGLLIAAILGVPPPTGGGRTRGGIRPPRR